MSEYSEMTFVATPEQKENVAKTLAKLFDATSISYVQPYNSERNYYRLVISELSLSESISILDKLINKHGWLSFVVTHGVYYGRRK